MKVEYKIYPDEIKCGCCGWKVSRLYFFKGDDPNELGMCGYCFSDYLADCLLDVFPKGMTEEKKKVEKPVEYWFEVHWAKKYGQSFIKAKTEEQAIERAESGRLISLKKYPEGKRFVEEAIPTDSETAKFLKRLIG